MQKGGCFKLGKQKSKHGSQEIDGGSQNSQGCGTQEVVQGGLGRCKVRQTLRTTQGRKARNALLQTIQACKLKDSSNCIRDYPSAKEEACSTEKETGSTQG
jgi:hypothetical protein